MDFILDDIEARVLGALVEKDMTTPEYYPLSLAALTAACNQKSNRDPVVDYDETTVVRALSSLREKRLVVRSDASRVPKYAETFVKRHNLLGREAAMLMVLLLRGPQTVGELRGRAERAYPFESLEEVESTMAALAETGYVLRLPRQPGRKECRYAQLLSGEPVVEEYAARPEAATLRVREEDDRLAALAVTVAELQAELDRLREEFARFKAQFE
ncbi:MAG: YceH family protein [Desulfobacteraceae bacterium]|nr:YceH family protein [Desulfobacteraceae bacterium]